MADDQIQVRIVGDSSSAEAALNTSADAVRQAATTMKVGLTQVQETARTAFATVGATARESASAVDGAAASTVTALARIDTAATSVTHTSGQMKFAMRDLGYQINDVSTMFAMGASPMMIFASQGGQIIGALQMMTGEATGLLGVLGGPWGMIIASATVALVPLIGKLFETGDAADQAKGKVYGLKEALADMRTKPMEALGELEKNVRVAEGKLNAANRMPFYKNPGADHDPFLEHLKANNARERAIQAAKSELQNARSELAIAKATEKTDEKLFNNPPPPPKPVAAPRITRSTGRASGGSTPAKEAARAAEQAMREELQERIAVTRQEQTLAEGKARTEIELSRNALQSKLADIDAELRNGQISGKQAVQQRADVNRQIAQLDQDLERKLYDAKLKELRDDQKNYAAGTREYRDYTRQIEVLEQQHQNRMAILKGQADAKRRQQDRILDTEGNRRMVGMANTWAQSLARMATLQQGFTATVKGLWQGIASLMAGIIEEMLRKWIIAQLAKLSLIKMEHVSTVASESALAGAGGVASMAAAPFPLNLSAPAFGASMAAAALAFGSAGFAAEGGYDVPAMAGPGVDGRGGQMGIVHPREMVLPAHIADNFRKGGAGGGTNVVIQAMDAKSFERFAKRNKSGVAKAVHSYARNNGR